MKQEPPSIRGRLHCAGRAISALRAPARGLLPPGALSPRRLATGGLLPAAGALAGGGLLPPTGALPCGGLLAARRLAAGRLAARRLAPGALAPGRFLAAGAGGRLLPSGATAARGLPPSAEPAARHGRRCGRRGRARER